VLVYRFPGYASAHKWSGQSRVLLGAAVALTIGGCGSSQVRTVTVSQTAPTSTPVLSQPASSPPKKRKARATRHAVSAPVPKPVTPSRFVSCDQNIQAKAATTTCGFAENAFYEYWMSGEAPDIDVYSPATRSTFSTTCTPGEGQVVCATSDGGVVRFSQASVDRYTQGQADRYAASHDLGSRAGSSNGGGSADSAPVPSQGNDLSFCDTHDCIPNYPNGNGYTVQCADGTYSQSGGIQGACSHHGGVG
jgi:hypothetical protein